MSWAVLLTLLAIEAWLCRPIVAAAWTGARRGDWLARAGLGFGLWAAAASAGTYVSARLGWFGTASWPGHAVVLACLLGARWLVRRRPASNAPVGSSADPSSAVGPRIRVLLGAAAAVAVASALAGGLLHVLRNPHGGYDAWWMWNTKARLLHLHDGTWSELLATISGLGHPDYPLLLPGLVATGLDLCATDTVAVPIVMGSAFAIASVGLVAGVLHAERSWALACVACVSLCGYRRFVAAAFDQTADVPLGFYLAGGLALLQRGVVTRCRAATVLGGAFLGAAAWTKNEGILAGAAVVLAGAAVLVREPRLAFGTLALVAAGALPGLAMVATWKSSVPATNDLASAWAAGSWSHLLDAARYPTVLRGFATAMPRWNGGAALAIVTLVVVSLWTRPLVGVADRAWKWSVLAILVILGGYLLVFVTTPAGQRWHLDTALVRLLAQLWPAVVLLALQRVDPRLLIPPARGDPG